MIVRNCSSTIVKTIIFVLLAIVVGRQYYVDGAVFTFDLVLKPSQEFVQYNDGYLRGPGSIDLSDLNFTAISESYKFMSSATGDDEYIPDDGGSTDDGDGGERYRRHLEGGVEQSATYIDIAVFKLPKKCAHAKTGCDWSALGVGKRSTAGDLRWCCSAESASLGLCSATDTEQFGRLMIDKTKYTGEHRFLSVPETGVMSKHIRYGQINEKESGTYVVLYANCNEEGREIRVTGKSVWLSKHGFLPGELFGFMYFYTFVTLVYAALFLWFVMLMVQHKDTRIDIEKWIIFAITLGLLEMTFRSGDYYVWNASGARSTFVIWVGILIGVFKQGISRTLAVMVSMGWGVSRDSLSFSAKVMSIGLAIGYIVISGISDCLIVFAVENISTLSFSKEKSIISFVSVLGFFKSVIETIFIVWVLNALSRTLEYLETNNEKTKLVRMQQLRNIFLVAVAIAFGVLVFSMADRVKEEGIVAEEHAWAKDAASELNYLFVLIGIAILWRPNESAQSYAYFKELSPVYDEDDDDDLELSDMNG